MRWQFSSFSIKRMQLSDIPAVQAIDRAVYPMPWPDRAYRHDLQQNEMAYYWVARYREEIIGCGGFWLMTDEIHINTLVVDPAWQGRGVGEWLLVALLEAGRNLGGKIATLEVRPSNRAARSLYAKYDFAEVGFRPRYYTNNEDALILTTPSLRSVNYQAFFNRRQAALTDRLNKLRSDYG